MRIAPVLALVACVPSAGAKIVRTQYGLRQGDHGVTLEQAIAGHAGAMQEVEVAHRERRAGWYWLAVGLAVEAAAIAGGVVLVDRHDDLAAAIVIPTGGLAGIAIGLWC